MSSINISAKAKQIDKKETQKLLNQFQGKRNHQYRRRFYEYLIRKQNVKSGAMRLVFITKNSVYKIARFDFTLDIFLMGWLANRNEVRKWHSANHLYSSLKDEINPKDFLCPVQRSFLFGIIIKMQRAEPLSKKEFYYNRNIISKINIDYWCGGQDELRLSNYGKIDDRFVCIDYGTD